MFSKIKILLLIISISVIGTATLLSQAKTSHHNSNNYENLNIHTIIPAKSSAGTNFDYLNSTKKKNVQQTKVDIDSVDYTLKVWEASSGDVVMTLKLKDKNQNVKISVWNMLGKSVLDDFEGSYKDLEEKHTIRNSNFLGRGAYILRIQSDKLKIDSKFIKTK